MLQIVLNLRQDTQSQWVFTMRWKKGRYDIHPYIILRVYEWTFRHNKNFVLGIIEIIYFQLTVRLLLQCKLFWILDGSRYFLGNNWDTACSLCLQALWRLKVHILMIHVFICESNKSRDFDYMNNYSVKLL